ncbi:MAG: MBOAT family protein [Lachnospiraceae bacterium]|nr:MBOAT family protein [Lachnospiraceae bacterium]
MLFSSIPFLYYFLPVVLILYFITPARLKNYTLLLASLFFYAWGEPRYVVLMLVSVGVGYILGLLTEKSRGKKAAKMWLALSVLFSVCMLGYFKYADFFLANFNAATGLSVPLLRIALPIGISFYTFQLLSYNIDVYRGDAAAQKNPFTLAMYISLFPQLIAGPIVRYVDVEEQLARRGHSFTRVALGIRRFVFGLSKKVLIANALGELCDIFRASGELSVLFYWMYALAFTLHIYFDFSGYSDMAIGLGHIFGFHFMENFRYPYISASITEFWRRWHISLGSWFRDYVYIPLGGNRVSKPRWFFNIFLVWMLTGFWHGAAWNFVVWGLFFAVLLIIEKLWLLNGLKRAKVLSHIYVIFCVVVSFVIFNAADLSQAMADLAGMFGGLNLPLVSAETVYYLRSFLVVFVIAIIGATPLPVKIVEAAKKSKAGQLVLDITEPLLLVVFLLLVTAYLVDGSFNPFLYFRF